MGNAERGARVTLSVAYSACCAFTISFLMGYPVYQEDRALGIVLGVIGFVEEAISTHCFQGYVIRSGELRESPHGQLLPTTEEPTTSDAKPSSSCTKNTLQIFYSLFALGKGYADRYYLAVTLLKLLFDVTVEKEDAWKLHVPLAFIVLLKYMFDLSNVIYESNKDIATSRCVNHSEDKPFYAPLFRKIAHYPKACEILRIAGSVEHVWMEDIFPILTYFPAAIFVALKNSNYFGWIVAGTVLGSLPLNLIVFAQTYLFEGRDTMKNFHELKGERYQSPPFSPCIVSCLRYTLWLMALLHGATLAYPPYTALMEIYELDNPEIKPENAETKYAVIIAATAFIFLIGTAATYLSEVTGALQELTSDKKLDYSAATANESDATHAGGTTNKPTAVELSANSEDRKPLDSFAANSEDGKRLNSTTTAATADTVIINGEYYPDSVSPPSASRTTYF